MKPQDTAVAANADSALNDGFPSREQPEIRNSTRSPIEGSDATAGPEAPSSGKDITAKRDSTTELPLYGLQEAIDFVSSIHEKALETLPMPQVATQMGYKHPSSTPFYRRCVAARLFGLMAKSGVELSARARSYLKPDGEHVRATAAREAVMGIQLYAEEVNKNLGKRMNTQFIANSFARILPITEGCALDCAKAFEQSLRFAGMLTTDGTVQMSDVVEAGTPKGQPIGHLSELNGTPHEGAEQTHTIFLDKTKTRRFTVSAPLELKATEIKRIQKWLEVTLQLDWTESSDP